MNLTSAPLPHQSSSGLVSQASILTVLEKLWQRVTVWNNDCLLLFSKFTKEKDGSWHLICLNVLLASFVHGLE